MILLEAREVKTMNFSLKYASQINRRDSLKARSENGLRSVRGRKILAMPVIDSLYKLFIFPV